MSDQNKTNQTRKTKQIIVKNGKFTIINNVPILTLEEQEKHAKDLIIKLHNILYGDK